MKPSSKCVNFVSCLFIHIHTNLVFFKPRNEQLLPYTCSTENYFHENIFSLFIFWENFTSTILVYLPERNHSKEASCCTELLLMTTASQFIGHRMTQIPSLVLFCKHSEKHHTWTTTADKELAHCYQKSATQFHQAEKLSEEVLHYLYISPQTKHLKGSWDKLKNCTDSTCFWGKEVTKRGRELQREQRETVARAKSRCIEEAERWVNRRLSAFSFESWCRRKMWKKTIGWEFACKQQAKALFCFQYVCTTQIAPKTCCMML